MKLGFVCAWGKNKRYSWSGTQWALFSNLKKYFDVIDIPIKRSYASIAKGRIKSFLKINDLGLSEIKKNQHTVKNQIKEDVDVIFQFDECPFYLGKNKPYQFIYQDMSVSAVRKLAEENSEVFNSSIFKNNSIKDIKKREKYQNDFYKDVDGIFTMGNWLKKELVTSCCLPEEKVFNVGGGCNIDTSRIDYSKKNGNKILFIGKEFETKNGDLVVEAFKIAKKKKNDLELYIIGPENLNIQYDGIFCLGRLPYEELPKYYNMCDIFCMPSKFEAYGIVFTEALCFGLPCIGRNAFEMPYFIEDKKTGRLLQSENSEELSNLMLEVLENNIYTENVRSKKDWYIKEYSWDNVCYKISNIIKEKTKNN